MGRYLASWWLRAGLVAASLCLYLAYAAKYANLGFPLDDSWIHQNFARNIALHGEWAYIPGQPSAGSTSPLWTILLIPGYLLPLGFKWWTYLLGAALLIAVSLGGQRLCIALFPQETTLAYLSGLLLLLEWHLIWAAFSGMEILLFVLLSLVLLERHLQGAHPFLVGLLGSLLMLTRPEGVILVALVAIHGLFRQSKKPLLALRDAGALLLGFALLLLPYLIFNIVVAGHPLPNTFYAKHAELWHMTRSIPLWKNFLYMLFPTLVGAQAILFPGFIWAACESIRGKAWDKILVLSWWASHLAIYALYLPNYRQHGRYVIPIIPILIILGLWGTKRLLMNVRHIAVNRVITRTALISAVFLVFSFWLAGARAYASDVRYIERELVDLAFWLRDNTPQEAVIGTHDIGAIGYFSERRLVDIAGLVNPEVIPFIDDEGAILRYLESKRVDYFVTFPGWYPGIVSSPKLQLIYRTDLPWTVGIGGENNAVYKTIW